MRKEAGELLKQCVDEAGLTQQEVVSQTGLSMVMLWRLFKGQAKLTPERLAVIARVCKLPQERISAIESALTAPPRKSAMPEAPQAFGAFISAKRCRLAKAYTTEVFANACGLSRSNFSLIEGGKSVPNPATAARIAVNLELSSPEQNLFFQLYGKALVHHTDLRRSVTSPALVAMLEWSILACSLSKGCTATVGGASQAMIDEVFQTKLASGKFLPPTLKKLNKSDPHALIECHLNGSYLFIPLVIKLPSK